MIYLFYGDDVSKKINASKKFFDSLPAGLETFYFSKNDFNKAEIENFFSGDSLFFTQCIIVLSGVFEREETSNFILSKLEMLGESKNYFVFNEGKLNKPIVDAFKKARAEINVFESPKKEKEKFNSFLLANALGDRDKLNLWIYFHQAVNHDVKMEELSGILFWKTKDMLLKKNFHKFSEDELKNLANKLACLLPEIRKEGKDPEIAFEQFLLKVF